jgi:hypothetical protein
MSNSYLPRLRPAVLLAAVAVWAGCSDNDDREAFGPGDGPVIAPLTVGLEASSATVKPGERVALAIRGTTGSGRPLAAMQGTLYFDARRLTYVGHDVGSFQIVNNSRASSGELRVASLNAKGIPARTATLVFTVKGADYLKGVRYAFKEAGTVDPEQVYLQAKLAGTTAGGLVVPTEAPHLTLKEWQSRLAPQLAGARAGGIRPNLAPGSIVANLKYGDATLDGNLNILDALDVANTSVGNNALINGTASPNRDRVVAANVFPANLPGVGDASDAIPPGVDAGGSQTNVDARSISILDALDIANESVGNDRPVPGAVIPGRGSLATTDSNLTCPITSNVTLGSSAKHYIIPKPATQTNVCEVQGATLTIAAGVTVLMDSNTLVIRRDSRIIADGTMLQPITIDCLHHTTGVGAQNGGPFDAGCNGGLYINGNAPINNGTATSPAIRNSTAGNLEAQGEGGSGLYGGGDPNDSSGVVRFVRVLNSGFRFSATNERNSFTLQGVGSRTRIDYIWADNGLDDGIEFFGGTPSVKHILVTRNQDDAFDWVGGFRGKAQFVIARGCDNACDNGIEADNFGIDGNSTDPEAAPRSAPRLFNFTLVGTTNPATPTTGFHGMLLRQNTAGFLRNFLVFNYKAGMDIDQPAGSTAGLVASQHICAVIAGVGNDTLRVRNALFAGSTNQADPDIDDPTEPAAGSDCGPYTTNGNNSGRSINPGNGTASNLEALYMADAANSITTPAGDATTLLVAPFNAPNSGTFDFRAKPGTAAASTVGATPPNDGFFDPSATYLGGVAPSTSGGGNIPWYAGWTLLP